MHQLRNQVVGGALLGSPKVVLARYEVHGGDRRRNTCFKTRKELLPNRAHRQEFLVQLDFW